MKLVTITTVDHPFKASLLKNRLEAEGIKPYLADEEIVYNFWVFSNAVGGIKIQVSEQEEEKARALVEQFLHENIDQHDLEREALASAPQDAFEKEEREAEDVPAPPVESEPAELELALTDREKLAQRTFRGAILGCVVPLLQPLIFWLVLKVYFSDERLGASYRRKTWLALLLCLPATLFMLWLFAGLIAAALL